MNLRLKFFEAVEVAAALEHYVKFCRRKKHDRSVQTCEGLLRRVMGSPPKKTRECEIPMKDQMKECPTCLGHRKIRDGETDERRLCLDCRGLGKVLA